MAFVSGGWKLAVTLMDNGGGTTSKSYDLTAADSTEAAAAETAIIARLQAVTDCTLISYQTYEQFINDSPVFPSVGVQKENQALLVFDIVGDPLKKATHSIPAPKQAIFVSASGANADVVDTGDNDVMEYRKIFQAVSGGGFAYISDGEVANTLLSGRRRHVRNSRG